MSARTIDQVRASLSLIVFSVGFIAASTPLLGMLLGLAPSYAGITNCMLTMVGCTVIVLVNAWIPSARSIAYGHWVWRNVGSKLSPEGQKAAQAELREKIRRSGRGWSYLYPSVSLESKL